MIDEGRAPRAVVGDAVCESRENGVECTVTSTRHGFTMSRTRYTLF